MPRKLPPHLYREITRHGRVSWYVRMGKGPRVRIKGDYGTPEFERQYSRAVGGQMDVARSKDTLEWLWIRYKDSRAWQGLSPATHRQRDAIMRHVIASGGKATIGDITRKVILASMEKRTAPQAKCFLKAMRGMFKWAVEAEHATIDPTVGIKTHQPKTDGFLMWTDEDIAAFEKRWPRGTRERVMFDVFLYTGLRIGDAAKLGRQHIRNGVITIDTEKNGMRVTIPVLAELQQTLDAGPLGDLAIITMTNGKGARKEVVGAAFRKACRAAKVSKSAHGLRKAAATHAADHGATVAELEAIFGWSGGNMAALYTRNSNRKTLAASAMSKLSRAKP